MTSLIYILQEDQACVAMDTLSLTSDDGKPLVFTSKMFPMPHLNGLICGTGVLNFVSNWVENVRTKFVVKDMEHLSMFTVEPIRKLWQDFHFNGQQTSTIYYFGYSKSSLRFKGYAFRSTNNFNKEELQYSIGIKPQVINMELNNIPDDIIRIMRDQKEQDDQLPLGQRLGIGGEIHLAVITQNQINIFNIHTFEDYDSCFHQMCERLSQNK
ncbi:MAG: hypothetical protein PHU23_08780 [Dehalococcoidales bacterium]|nr:hypothetical protein [Dehalococcoidales bacterium]